MGDHEAGVEAALVHQEGGQLAQGGVAQALDPPLADGGIIVKTIVWGLKSNKCLLIGWPSRPTPVRFKKLCWSPLSWCVCFHLSWIIR